MKHPGWDQMVTAALLNIEAVKIKVWDLKQQPTACSMIKGLEKTLKLGHWIGLRKRTSEGASKNKGG